MPKIYKKKLIEVALPLEAINAASAREKSLRYGHPSTMLLWWARRPFEREGHAPILWHVRDLMEASRQERMPISAVGGLRKNARPRGPELVAAPEGFAG